jgi:hypothetical protein
MYGIAHRCIEVTGIVIATRKKGEAALPPQP